MLSCKIALDARYARPRQWPLSFRSYWSEDMSCLRASPYYRARLSLVLRCIWPRRYIAVIYPHDYDRQQKGRNAATLYVDKPFCLEKFGQDRALDFGLSVFHDELRCDVFHTNSIALSENGLAVKRHINAHR